MAVCSFVVSLECADHFYNYWNVRLVGCCYLDYRQRPRWRLAGWIFLSTYILYVFRWYSPFAVVLPFCPANGSGVASREKAQESKAVSEMKALQPSG